MQIYLVIITTALVATQIIRVTQNHIHLRRERKLMKLSLSEIEGITKDEMQIKKENDEMLHRILPMIENRISNDYDLEQEE